jgi:adenosylcobinamide amidohydrolase
MSAATVRTSARPELAPSIALRDRMLLVSFGGRVRACSWAIVGGGFARARHVAWIEVQDAELRPPVDPRVLACERLRAEGLEGDVIGLLTSRRVATFEECAMEDGEVVARAVATVGLGNALRAGDPAGVAGRIGTINLLVHVSAPLTDEAILEASAIATEAKTAAVLEAQITSRRTGRPATGTGTDCTVLACTPAPGRREVYAGKHTRTGALVGAAAHRVVRAGVRRWLEENAGAPS